MKIKMEIDENLQEEEIIVRCRELVMMWWQCREGLRRLFMQACG